MPPPSSNRIHQQKKQHPAHGSAAHETGIFFYSTINTKGERTQEYLRFETLLVKREDGWKTLMEYQKTQATQQEWDALPK